MPYLKHNPSDHCCCSPDPQEAVQRDEAVSSSLLPALEGAAEPAQLSAPAMPASPRRPAAGSGQPVVPVAVGDSDKKTAREAAMHSTQVDASLAVEQEAPEVGDAELAEQEAAAGAQASGPGTSQGSPRSAAGASRGHVLPVAVTAADRQTTRQAATRSPAVDASLAAEQEAPEVGEAELKAAAAAQPEGLDATQEYLAERTEARQQSGLGAGSRPSSGEHPALAGGSADSESRLRMKVGGPQYLRAWCQKEPQDCFGIVCAPCPTPTPTVLEWPAAGKGCEPGD